ncbi:MAG: hypothetical protein M0T73_02785 [Deltaproteobacteria bacterium]|nr:hypothetical protein [Deltaproteobacteria bacterium]
MSANPDIEKTEDYNDPEPDQKKIESKPACHKVFSGIKESAHSRWNIEFSRRFGPG